MDNQFIQLRQLLLEVRNALGRRGVVSSAAWEKNALQTAIDNLNSYLGRLDDGISDKNFEECKTSSCLISTIGKGISDNGLLDHSQDTDRVILEMIGELTVLSGGLCRTPSPSPELAGKLP